jgi:hypothetical protein
MRLCSMDHRVKPGGDDRKDTSRERDCLSPVRSARAERKDEPFAVLERLPFNRLRELPAPKS